MNKKILSVLLCLVMVIGMLPTVAFAAEDPVLTPEDLSQVVVEVKCEQENKTASCLSMSSPLTKRAATAWSLLTVNST